MKKAVLSVVTSLLLLAFVSGSLFAAGGGQQSSGGAAQPGEISGTLEFWGPDGAGANPNDPGNVWWRETIAAFKAKYPKVNMQISSTPGTANEYLVKLSTEIAAGRSADVMMVWPSARLQPFVEANMVRPLNYFLDARPELKKTISSIALSYFTFGDSFYGIPMDTSGELIFYNKKIFSDNGLSVPKTFDDLMKISDALNVKGIIPMTVGGKDIWPVAIPYMMLIERLYGLDFYNEVIVGHDPKFDDPLFAETGRRIYEMQKRGVFSPNINAISHSEASAEFTSGKAAMWPSGIWELGNLIDLMGDNLGFFNFPDVPGGKGSAEDWLINYGSGYSISTQSKNLAAAEAWLEFMFDPKRQADLMEKGHPTPSINLPVNTSKVNPVMYAILTATGAAKHAYIPFDNPLGTVMGNEFNMAVQRCHAGEDPVKVFQDLNRIAKMEWQ
jgi:raffinose/stachyose/melibiose transport system substrate-binding protein